MKNIIFIGMPAVGKSTVGVVVAKRLGYEFIDTDLLIQKQENRLLREIIAEEGLNGFLSIENQVNRDVEAEHAVISPGGSVVYCEEAMKHYKEIGTIVYLHASFEVINSRLKNAKKRGVALRDGQTLKDLYDERVVLFEKYADITVKAPRNLLYLEDKVRKSVLNRVARGKIEVFISYANYGLDGKNVVLNKELAKLYIKELTELAEEADIPSGLRATEVSKMPDVLNIQLEEDSLETIWQELSECLETAIDNFIDMRSIEGSKIKQDLQTRLSSVEENVNKISELSTGLVEEYIVKLEERIKELLKIDIVDKDRLAQEIVIYSDKCSTEEELTRLKSHIAQFKNLLEQEEPVGKKLDFLIQEMNRETNTIGSKSGKLEITNLVIEMKTVLEDIREQIQNIE